MKSVGELILEGHFSKLKDDINQRVNIDEGLQTDELLEGLNQAFQYLKKLSEKDLLDTEGAKIYDHLASLLDLSATNSYKMPGKMPMAKAGRKSIKNQKGKTGT